MAKKRLRLIIKWGIVALLCALFVNTCMMTKVPDKITRIYETEPIKAYKFYQRSDDSYYSIGYDVIPGQPLNISFKPSIFWPTDNDDEIYVWGNLFLENKYETFYVKEISYNYNGKNNILVKDRRIAIPMDEYDILLDENREPAIIGGKYLYGVRIAHGFLFNWDEKAEFDFSPRRFGEKKEIEVIQIYSFDNMTWHEEKLKYEVICGGKKFDMKRPILNWGSLFL
jgi:hypothetical protein